jgi:hypothetical protein
VGNDDNPEKTLLPRWTLRDLPLVGRMVVSVFLIAVGVGYFSALVQLHFQQAARGQLLPGPAEVTHAYHGHLVIGPYLAAQRAALGM